MRFGLLGTGMVGRTLAGKLTEMGHEVFFGTRDVSAVLKNNEPDAFGNPPFRTWMGANPSVSIETFENAAAHGDLIINATAGSGSLQALKSAGAKNLNDKILIDVANLLDFPKGLPPQVSIADGDSLGERIQHEFPEAKVVKTLNTVSAPVMVAPGSVASGDHTMFVCGNDSRAKATVSELLRSFGWRDIIDLGDITAARGTEHFLALWLRLWGAKNTPLLNIKVVT